MAILVSKEQATTEVILICVVCAAIQDYGVVWSQAAAQGHVYAMSGSMAIQLPVLMSVTPARTKGCEDSRGLNSYLRPYQCPKALLQPGSY